MNIKGAILCLILLISIAQVFGQTKDLTLYVNPLLGTSGKQKVEYRGNMPVVTTPFGMTQWTPMTRENNPGSVLYHYADSYIKGFSATHQPAIWMGDYGYVALMPGTGKVRTGIEERRLPFSHNQEKSYPYSYEVWMGHADSLIKTRFTATSHCSIFQFDYSAAKERPFVVIDAIRNETFTGYIKIDRNRNEIIGYNPDRRRANRSKALPNFKGYFVIRFDTDFDSVGVYNQKKLIKDTCEILGKYVGAFVTFKKHKTIKAKIATSFISIEQAKKNLDAEVKDWDLCTLEDNLKAKWNQELSKVQIKAPREEMIRFYSALYQCYLFPRKIEEFGKYYSAADDRIHDGLSYNDFSLWDTFRAQHPLLVLLQPKVAAEMITAMLQMYDQSGWLPMWPNPAETNVMIGTHADAVIADAVVKGINGFDLAKAYKAVHKDAFNPPDGDTVKKWPPNAPWNGFEARWGLTYLQKTGFVPQDKVSESVSRTLEYSYDDFCVAQVAKAAGHLGEYKMLLSRSKNYRNLFDKEAGKMYPKNADGSWHYPRTDGFTEGSPWTYLFCVMQDIPGLINLMGGENYFSLKLDSNFNQGYYKHDNEPGHHYSYLYDYCGEPWKTQRLVANIIKEYYPVDPSKGPDGNEDCGQMSAWYIFSSLGFYPVTPGSTIYAIGTPRHSSAVINLGVKSGREFKIEAKNLSEKNIYIQVARLDGRVLKHPFINHSDIVKGKKLVFYMGSAPNKNWK